MQAEFGWSRTALSIAPIASLLNALLLPATGVILDRVGPRRVAIGGTIAMAATLALFGMLGARVAAFVALVLMLALAGASINSLVLARGIAG